jgi:hypothetical protein
MKKALKIAPQSIFSAGAGVFAYAKPLKRIFFRLFFKVSFRGPLTAS